jgi:hypothetical protein
MCVRLCNTGGYGYAKAVAAMQAVKAGEDGLAFDKALDVVKALIRGAHNPVAWDYDVAKKAAQLVVREECSRWLS